MDSVVEAILNQLSLALELHCFSWHSCSLWGGGAFRLALPRYPFSRDSPRASFIHRQKRRSEKQHPYRNTRHLLSPRAASVGPAVPFLLFGKRESSGRVVPLDRRKIRPSPSSPFSAPKPSEPPLISRKRIARAIYI